MSPVFSLVSDHFIDLYSVTLQVFVMLLCLAQGTNQTGHIQ